LISRSSGDERLPLDSFIEVWAKFASLDLRSPRGSEAFRPLPEPNFQPPRGYRGSEMKLIPLDFDALVAQGDNLPQHESS